MAGPNNVKSYFDKLNEQATIEFKGKTPNLLCARIDKMYSMAQAKTRAKDFTEAYIYFTRWIRCVEWIQTKGMDRESAEKYYPDKRIREVKNILDVITTTLKTEFENQHKTKTVTNRKSNINKDIDIDLHLPEVPNDEPQPKDKTDISCKELFDMFNQLNENTTKRILIIDVRSSKDYSTSRISFENNMIHIPADQCKEDNIPGEYQYIIKNQSGKEAEARFKNRSSKHTDLIVLVDTNSTSSTMNSNSAIAKFKKSLEKSDPMTDYKRIAILKGGFETWKKMYPNCVSTSPKFTTNSSASNNSKSGSDSFHFPLETNKSMDASPVTPNYIQEPNSDFLSPVYVSKHPPGKQINIKSQLSTINTPHSTTMIPQSNFNFGHSETETISDSLSPIFVSKHPPGKQINLKSQLSTINTPNSIAMMPRNDFNFAHSTPMNSEGPNTQLANADFHSHALSQQHTSEILGPQNSTNSIPSVASNNASNLASLYHDLPNEFDKALQVPIAPSAPVINGSHSYGSIDRHLREANQVTREPKVVLNKIPSVRPNVDRSNKPGRSKIVELEYELLELREKIADLRAKHQHHMLTNWEYEEFETLIKQEQEMAEKLKQKKAADSSLYPDLQSMNFSLGTRSRAANSPKPSPSESKENIPELRPPKKIKTPPPMPEISTPPVQKIPAPAQKELPLSSRLTVVTDDDEEMEIHREPLKHEPAAINTGLKRSISSPNLTQVKKFKANDGQGKLKEERRIVPDIDRTTKPKNAAQNTAKQAYTYLSSKDRMQRMEPVYASSGAHPGITGLKNLGNSCYMNSIIQCLSNTECLAKYFTENLYVDDLNKNEKIVTNVAEEVAQVIKALWRGQYKSISPRDLKISVGQSKLQFGSYDQQDSHEFLMFLLDWMHNDLKQKSKVSYNRELTTAEKEWEKSMNGQCSMISNLFFGQLRSTIECLSCNKTSMTYETFNSLTMSLPDFNKCKLDDCVKKFVSGQNVSGWKCPNCKVPREGIKKFDIAKLPHIIVIHLNRFGDTRGWLEKKSTAVDFPLTNFNLKPYTVQEGESENNANTYYNLYAMSNHYGTMDGGHYTAYCRSYAQNKWYKYDDHTVNEVSANQVQNQSSSAYLLFYASAKAEAFLNR